MRIILHWIIISVAVWATTQLVAGVIVSPFYMALIVGACMTLVNMFLKPIINILTLPLNILTLGFFSLFINGAIFWYLGSGVIKGFSVSTFTAAFVGALLVSVLNWIIMKIFHFDF
jgi:putative membrane protein